MSEAVTVALITGGMAVLSAIASALISSQNMSKKILHSMDVKQAVTDTKITELTREVREHNGFARRVPSLEQEVKDIKNDIRRLETFHLHGNN